MTAVMPQRSFLDVLVDALDAAGAYNSQYQEPPAAILWPDEKGQWKELIPALIARGTPLYTLGEYAPDERRGPGYWLRCIVDRTIDPLRAKGETPHAEDDPPILYLPGFSREDVRADEKCPFELKPLAELKYRGVLWTQQNSRDWTIKAFLQNKDNGLGLDVDSDAATERGLLESLPELAHQTLHALRGAAPIRAAFLDRLVIRDPDRSVLDWLVNPAAFHSRLSDRERAAFIDICKDRYGFDPEGDDPIEAARLLGQRAVGWETTWSRFVEAPGRYRGVIEALRQARHEGPLTLFDRQDSWPQDNEQAEMRLREGIEGLTRLGPEAARTRIRELEGEHGERRGWVWAKLDSSPLASALEHLALLAETTRRPLAGKTVPGIVDAYSREGWQTDLAALDALSQVSGSDRTIVRDAVASIYRPWLEAGARAFQSAFAEDPGSYVPMPAPTVEEGTCVMFADGLRYDVAVRLTEILKEDGIDCTATPGLAALPTVTATGKPSVSPSAGSVSEDSPRPEGDVAPVWPDSGAKVVAAGLRDAIAAGDVQVLDEDRDGEPSGRAWTEFGNIDVSGHTRGVRFEDAWGPELCRIAERIGALLQHGWRRIMVVTDHGWLLLPGGLPTAELPEHLTDFRKARFALLKPGSPSDDLPIVPWRWNQSVEFVGAPNIHCFQGTPEYAHGGLSPQECVVPIVSVTAREDAARPAVDSVEWRRLRCIVTVDGATEGMRLDIRTRAGDASRSLTDGAKEITAEGSASLLVLDDEHEGTAAIIVILQAGGTVAAQASTIIGGA